MKKVVLIMFLILVGFTINVGFVSAAGTNSNGTLEISAGAGKTDNSGFERSDSSCGILGDPNNDQTIAFYLQQVFNIIRFLGPILVLLMTIFDLVKITAEQKQDGELQKIGVKTLKRLIYAVILFMLPTLINTVFGLIGLYGTCGVS